MKPEWKDAPEWAKFLAQDPDGSWWWYEERPLPTADGNWTNQLRTKYEQACYAFGVLEERP